MDAKETRRRRQAERRRQQRLAELPFPHRGFPVTAVILAWSVVAFVSLEANPELFTQLGYANAHEVIDGAWYALLSSVCLHGGLLHLAFNGYWLWTLGRPMEQTLGSGRYLAFVVLAAWVSSALEMTLVGEVGIGLSGVVYAMACYMWIAGRRIPWFAVMDNQNMKIFAGWFVLCIVMTQAGVWNIANVAHGAGALFGLAVGARFAVQRQARLAVAALAAMLVLSVLAVAWAPWSVSWQRHQAYQLLVAEDFQAAEQAYTELIESGGQAVGFLYWNRGVARQRLGREQEAAQDFYQARNLDPEIDR